MNGVCNSFIDRKLFPYFLTEQVLRLKRSNKDTFDIFFILQFTFPRRWICTKLCVRANETNLCFIVFQVTLEIITMVRVIPWNPTESAWLTTFCSTMDSTERWRFMYVTFLQLAEWVFGIFQLFVRPGNSPVLFFSVRTKLTERRWPSTTATITLSSCARSGQTTCQSTASRCRDVSISHSSALTGCPQEHLHHFSPLALQLMWERTARCLMVYLSSASCP